jgi:hypothetical protein
MISPTGKHIYTGVREVGKDICKYCYKSNFN